MGLSVRKSDGQCEPYIHTRVMSTIAAAVSDANCYDEQTVNALSDAVRMYVEDCRDENNQTIVIQSDEIYAMILACLQETGFVLAAELLKKHRVNRQIRRSRQLILHCLKRHLPVAERTTMEDVCCVEKKGYFICEEDACPCFSLEPWNKSRLVFSLIKNYCMSLPAARALAGNIEEKVFNLKSSVVRSEIISQLVYNEFYFIRKHDIFFEVSKKPKHNTDEQLPVIMEISSEKEVNDYLTLEK